MLCGPRRRPRPPLPAVAIARSGRGINVFRGKLLVAAAFGDAAGVCASL